MLLDRREYQVTLIEPVTADDNGVNSLACLANIIFVFVHKISQKFSHLK